MASRSPLEGTPLEGMEHLFGLIIRQDEENGPVTFTVRTPRLFSYHLAHGFLLPALIDWTWY